MAVPPDRHLQVLLVDACVGRHPVSPGLWGMLDMSYVAVPSAEQALDALSLVDRDVFRPNLVIIGCGQCIVADGARVLERLQTHDALAGIPVVFLSAGDDPRLYLEIAAAGSGVVENAPGDSCVDSTRHRVLTDE